MFLQQLGKGEEEHSGSVGPCKKKQRVSVSGQEYGVERNCVHGSQHFCTEECNLVADTEKSPSDSPNYLHDGDNSDCVTHSLTLSTESHLPTSSVSGLCQEDSLNKSPIDGKHSIGPGKPSAISPDVCSCFKGPNRSDFVLTGLHACGDLSATLLRHFVNCPHVRGITSVACCYMKITTKENPSPPGVVPPPLSDNSKGLSQSDYGYPMSDWVRGLPEHELSYKAREGACHAIEDYLHRLREESALLKTHCYRAALESIVRAERPHLRRAGIQTIKKAHTLSFSESVSLLLLLNCRKDVSCVL